MKIFTELPCYGLYS